MLTPVIPTSYPTDRQDLNDAIEALIDAFIASESYQVGRKFLSEMPDNLMAESPLIILGDIEELLDQGEMNTYQRTFTGTLIYLDRINERRAVNARINRWADRMATLFAVNRGILEDGVLQQTSFAEGEWRQGKFVFAGPHLTFTWNVQRGFS